MTSENLNFKRDHVESKLKTLFITRGWWGTRLLMKRVSTFSSALPLPLFIGGINLAQENADDLHQKFYTFTWRSKLTELTWSFHGFLCHYEVSLHRFLPPQKKRQPLMVEFDEMVKLKRKEEAHRVSFWNSRLSLLSKRHAYVSRLLKDLVMLKQPRISIWVFLQWRQVFTGSLKDSKKR
jgi:hypothetical protein